MFGGGNMQGMMKKVQKMQKDMQKMQDEMKETILDAKAGGGAVVVHMNGEKKVVSIKIDPAAVDPDDVEALEDLIVVAVNEASRKVDDTLQQKMDKITGGVKMPGLF